MGEAYLVVPDRTSYIPESQELSVSWNGSYNCYGQYWQSPFSFSCGTSTRAYPYAIVYFSYKSSHASGPLEVTISRGGTITNDFTIVSSDYYGAIFSISFSFSGLTVTATCTLNQRVSSNGSAYFVDSVAYPTKCVLRN